MDVYVVTSKLHTHETSFLSDRPGQWVRSMLDAVGVSYVLDAVTRCAADKPTAKQKSICSQSFLLSNIKTHMPKSILCLGLDAAQAVLGSKLTLSVLSKAGIMEGPHGIPTIVVDHPSLHSSFRQEQWNGADLREDYKRAFSQIHEVLKNGWAPPVLDYQVFDTCDSILTFLDTFHFKTAVASWDTEFGVQVQWNITHPTTELVTTGFGWREGKGMGDYDYKVAVFDLVDLTREQKYKVLSRMLADMVVVSTFVKIDFQVSYFTSGYCAFNGGGKVRSFYDTGQLRWLQDQERKGNGLEEQCVEYLGAQRWKYKTDDKLKEIAAAKPGDEAYVPLEERLQQHDYRHLPRDFRNEYQAWDLYWQARLWYERYADPENPCNLRKEYDIWPWRRTQAFTEFLCYCERVGLVVDMDYLQLYLSVTQKKSEYLLKWINEHPYVKELQRTLDPNKPSGPILGPDGQLETWKSGPRKGEIKQHPAHYLLPEEGLNPGSSPQMSTVMEFLGLKTKQVTDKTQRPKVDADELKRQIASNPGGRGEFFRAILLWRQAEKQIGAFISPFIQYAVEAKPGMAGYEPGQYRAHPMFKMSKVESGSGTDALLAGGVDSGRVSSTNPCGTNIDKNPKFRRSFPAPTGWLCWEEDQASVEPRVLAYNSGCRSWIDMFKLRAKEPENPEADLYRVEWRNFMRSQGKTWYQAGDVTKDERQQCKPLVLGGMYDATPYGVSQREGIPLEICEQFMKQFWDNIPEIAAYNAEARRKCFEGEMIVGTSGGRCFFQFKGNYAYDHDKHKHLSLLELQKVLGMPEEDAHIARKLCNFLTQKTAKDITDVTAIEMVKEVKKQGIGWLMFNNTVHDSLWGYVKEEHLVDLYWLVQRIAPNPKLLTQWGIQFNTSEPILLAAEVKAGPHLGAMEEVHFEKPKSLRKVPGLA